MLRFYDCLTAPSPRRVRMLIAEKGIELETIQIDLANGAHLSDAFRAINPQQTVPVLELEDGTKLLDSNSISLYLDEVFPGPNLTGTNPQERAVIAMWQRDMDLNGLLAVAECFRNSSKGFHNRALTGPVDYEQIPELAERGRRRVRRFFADLNCRLADSEYVAGGRFTVADITAFISVEFARAIREYIPDVAVNLKRWRDAVAARPSARA
jgi:glutathione S-transferase